MIGHLKEISQSLSKAVANVPEEPTNSKNQPGNSSATTDGFLEQPTNHHNKLDNCSAKKYVPGTTQSLTKSAQFSANGMI